ncbi:MAG: LysM peptidoglycan-binding domain-containing protein, partial [Methyloceanibacter sp.]
MPQESVYASGAPSYGGGSYARSSVPPPSGSYAQATPAAYSPAGADMTASIRPQRAAYTPQAAVPQANPAVLRTTSHPRPARTETITVSQGDNLYTLSRRYRVSVDAIQSANDLSDARLK